MTSSQLLDAAGRRRSPATMPGRAGSEDPCCAAVDQRGDLGVTSIYLQGIDNSEIIETVHARPAQTLPASAGLRV
jgi:hypothetical protein